MAFGQKGRNCANFSMSFDPFPNAIFLTGPTGSGKSALALEIAERIGGEIISMDSMAVYRGMDIGTAKPSVDERRRVPHHLIDVLDPWESATVAWWRERAEQCYSEISERGKRVLFVGGTPLYLKALLHGLFDGPPADDAIRKRLTDEAKQLGNGVLHDRLQLCDPDAAARIHPNDLRRTIRALEVFELTGQPMSTWQNEWKAKREHLKQRAIWLDLPRTELYDRINRRVATMFEIGLVDEVRALQQLECPLSREASQALGYKEVFRLLEGTATLAETIAEVQTRTRNFAKRQLTWFRNMPECRALRAEEIRKLAKDEQL